MNHQAGVIEAEQSLGNGAQASRIDDVDGRVFTDEAIVAPPMCQPVSPRTVHGDVLMVSEIIISLSFLSCFCFKESCPDAPFVAPTLENMG